MLKLAEIMKKRAAVPLDTILPPHILEMFNSGQIPADRVGPVIDQLADVTAESAVRKHRVPHRHQAALSHYLRRQLKYHQPKLEAAAYRGSTGSNGPENYTQLGVNTAVGLGIGAGMSAVFDRINTGKWRMPSILDTASFTFGPASFLPNIMFSGVGTAFDPLKDPLYRKGKRGYLASLKESLEGQADAIDRHSEKIDKEYGVAGLPLRAAHAIFNPLGSLYSTGRGIKDYFMGKEGAERVKEASLAVEDALS